MSIINYENLAQTLDTRVVKTKRSIFIALVSLLQTQRLEEITITDICKKALINRKTFYCHYDSVQSSFTDMESLIIAGYINELKHKNIILMPDFSASTFIQFTHDLIQKYKQDFKTLYPYFRKGTFVRELGTALGKEVAKYVMDNPSIHDESVFIFSFVFSLTGLLVSYFDWIDSEQPVPLTHLKQTAETVFSIPLRDILRTE